METRESVPSLPMLTGAQVNSSSTRCRYKTGRCPNSRALKANGTLLLLCEYHRHQQNRTKKRSDMKCRHDRAKKRQAQREKLHTKQLPIVSLDKDKETHTKSWSQPTLPLASVIPPQVTEEYVASSSLTVTAQEKVVFESTSPTAVDFDVVSMNWTPRCASVSSTPAMRLHDTSFAPEDIWLLKYFIL